jgi:S-adenosylmethionine synthetase
LITNGLREYREAHPGSGLLPDAKAQVTVEYANNKFKRIHTIVVSTQHDKSLTLHNLVPIIRGLVLDIFKHQGNGYLELIDQDTIFHINPAGTFHIGGSVGDAGLTGRKIIVDTYGGYCPHGGGAFSGKDYTKVDRSGAYMARDIAKNIVSTGYCTEATVQLSYAIGVKEPVSVSIETDNRVINDYLNTNGQGDIKKIFDCSPEGIINTLDLKNISYRKTAENGHVGKPEFPWEKVDKVDELKKALRVL